MTAYRLVASRFDQIVERHPNRAPKRVVRHRFGDLVEGLSDAEVDRLLRAGAIRPAADVDAEDVGVVEVDQDDATTPAEAVARPKQTAPVKDWEDYAVSQGFDRAEVEAMSKSDLIKALA